jgi:CRP/FNR family transcriptional regulator, dissimilatory nitrate respiration regulator
MLAPSIKVGTFLGNTPLFKELADDKIRRIGDHARIIRAERGTILCHRGDPATGFYIVVYGQAKLYFTSLRGDEKVLEVLGPGQSFGEAVMFTSRPFPVTAEALVDSLFLFVQRETVIAELERDPRLATRIIGGLSRRVHGLIADVEAYSLCSGVQRVIGYLLRECESEVDGAYDVTLPTTKGVIASLLNVTQEHFSRILHELNSQGLIEVRGRAIRVSDVARLREYCM